MVITLKEKHEIGLFLLIFNAYKNTKCVYHRTLSVTLYKQIFFCFNTGSCSSFEDITCDSWTHVVSVMYIIQQKWLCHSDHLASSNLRLYQLLDLIRCQKCGLELTKYHSHLIHNFMLLNFTFSSITLMSSLWQEKAQIIASQISEK